MTKGEIDGMNEKEGKELKFSVGVQELHLMMG